ncbi:CHAP domain-containing protein [Mycolicibacterium sp.]|uniref:CHAP domain-containing protein n=1 Tax=Mycolicibacterium sp. TaxID=2320850 RepID=UPI001A1DD14F|nr:CHAP domain-containing protein [Mycolicibacterium sp.]MBJ7340371.1 CHAP domain-containing protein [Mycolicibacterium sp.]
MIVTGSRPRKTARDRLGALMIAALVAGMGVQSVAEVPRASADSGATVEAAQVGNVARATGRTQANNPGTPGQCTWGAAQKWFEASGSYPAMRGDAMAWRDSAIAAGWTVVDAAQPRSIVVFPPGVAGAGGYGHVAWVDSVSRGPTGTVIHVTEMNNLQAGGVGIFNDRDVIEVAGMSYVLLP